MSNNIKEILTQQLQEAKDNNKQEDVQRLEELLKSLENQNQEHQEEMVEVTNKENIQKNIKVENLKNQLEDKPEDIKQENIKENTEEMIEQWKTRLKTTIERYTSKIKELKSANESEKAKVQKELEDIKATLKKEKENYEQAKSFFIGKTEYKPENLERISTRWIRFGKKEKKWWVVTRTFTERLQFSTIRRRRTINKLIKKFNKIGDNPQKGVRFISGFDSERFLRYTGVNMSIWIDKLWTWMGMKINAKDFHQQFSWGKKNIFAVLDTWEKTEEEEKIIDAIKKRINYYGYAYARQRASEWTDPFLTAEKETPKEDRIIQMGDNRLAA